MYYQYQDRTKKGWDNNKGHCNIQMEQIKDEVKQYKNIISRQELSTQ